MKNFILTLLFSLFGLLSQAQNDSIPNNQFHLKAKLVKVSEMPKYKCGCVSFATVMEFKVINFYKMKYPKRKIHIIVPCPEDYCSNFFVAGKIYEIDVLYDKELHKNHYLSEKDLALLKKNNIEFEAKNCMKKI